MSPAKIALVTGANRGIGLSLVKALQARGMDVIGACRHDSEALASTGARVERLDVTSPESAEALAERLGDTRIDLLINNAGVLRQDQLGALDFDSLRTQFEVNSLGPLRVTQALLGKLAPGAKVAVVTSRMGSIADNTSGGMYGYRMSKAAANAAGKSLAMDLKDRGHPVVILHPGWVKTDMTGGRGHLGPDESAAGLLDRIDAVDLTSTGTFHHANGEELPW